jgi:hypothetical protein
LSKKEGKKRAADEEGEATATDDEEPGPSKGGKRRKTQTK